MLTFLAHIYVHALRLALSVFNIGFTCAIHQSNQAATLPLTRYNPILISLIEHCSLMKEEDHVQGCYSLRTNKRGIVSESENQF